MIKKESLFKIGQFAKPHGVKGELSLITDYSLSEGDDDLFLICEIDGILVPFLVESFRPKSSSVLLVKLENVNDEQAAKRLAHKKVYYPLEEQDEISYDGTTGWGRLIGFKVVDKLLGDLGEVIKVDESTMNVLLLIENEQEELLIPIANELIIEENMERKMLHVALPEGILQL